MTTTTPHAVILAGPNGAGKSTAAPLLLQGTLGVEEFVNADVIAQGLSGFRPEAAAMEAGRVTLARIAHLAQQRVTFAFETTLAGRTLAARIADLHNIGYETRLVYLWLPSADLAIERVHGRMSLGGHAVPDDVVGRRYAAGLRNLNTLYLPLVTSWRVYNSAEPGPPCFVASGRGRGVSEAFDTIIWERIRREGK